MDLALETTRSILMQEVLTTIRRVAASDLSVLIVGEHGAGKQWAARTIHQSSGRASGPFHPVACAALAADATEKEIFGYEAITWNGIDIKRGAIEEASGGTLVLDEIASLPPALQMKIARVAEYGFARRISGETEIPVNARIIVTQTRQNDAPAAEDLVHQEMFFRISPIVIEVPPLRKRIEDIAALIDTFLADLRHRHGSSVERMSEPALAICRQFDWPGNVRQLKNAIEYATVMCDGSAIIAPSHLPSFLQTPRTEG